MVTIRESKAGMRARPTTSTHFVGRIARRSHSGWSLQSVGQFNLSARGVLLEVSHCGICGSDLKMSSSHHFSNELLVTPGHEIAGTVIAVGADVEYVSVGDRVCVSSLVPCKSCKACMMGQPALCQWPQGVGQDIDGGFADYVIVPDSNVYVIPDFFTWEHAALIEPLAAAIHGLSRANLSNADRILVIGAGSLGLLVSLVARIQFHTQLTMVVAKYEHQAKFAESLGVNGVIRYEPSMLNLFPLVNELSCGEMASVVVEAAGGMDFNDISSGLQVLDRGGRLLVLGRLMKHRRIDLHAVMKRELSILGSCKSGCRTDLANSTFAVSDDDFRRAIHFCASLPEPLFAALKMLVTHKFPLQDIGMAFQVAREKQANQSIKVHVTAAGVRPNL